VVERLAASRVDQVNGDVESSFSQAPPSPAGLRRGGPSPARSPRGPALQAVSCRPEPVASQAR